jgi:hypothetical protein
MKRDKTGIRSASVALVMRAALIVQTDWILQRSTAPTHAGAASAGEHCHVMSQAEASAHRSNDDALLDALRLFFKDNLDRQ